MYFIFAADATSSYIYVFESEYMLSIYYVPKCARFKYAVVGYLIKLIKNVTEVLLIGEREVYQA